jgi:hypothetical protein
VLVLALLGAGHPANNAGEGQAHRALDGVRDQSAVLAAQIDIVEVWAEGGVERLDLVAHQIAIGRIDIVVGAPGRPGQGLRGLVPDNAEIAQGLLHGALDRFLFRESGGGDGHQEEGGQNQNGGGDARFHVG